MKMDNRSYAIIMTVMWAIMLIIMVVTGIQRSQEQVWVVGGLSWQEKIMLSEDEMFARDAYEIVETDAGRDVVVHIVDKE